MNRRSFIATTAAMSALPMAINQTANAATRSPAVFLFPHADDGLLSMSVSIFQHLDAGRDCIFVLMTQGSSESLRNIVSSRYGSEVTPNQIINSRRREFIDEVSVYEDSGNGRVLIKQYDDGSLTYDQVKRTVLDIEMDHPGADFKVMSYLDGHPDHAQCGKVVRDLYDQGRISSVPRYYVKRSDRVKGVGDGLVWNVTATDNVQDRIEKAATGYTVWDPNRSRFSVGYTSVGTSFNARMERAIDYIHS